MNLDQVNSFDYVADSIEIDVLAKETEGDVQAAETVKDKPEEDLIESPVHYTDHAYLIYVVLIVVFLVLFIVANVVITDALNKEIQEINAEVIEESSEKAVD